MGQPRPSFVAGFLALGTAAFYLAFWCTQLFTVGLGISAESEEFHRYVLLAALPVICLGTGFGYLGGLGRSRIIGPVLLGLVLLGVAGALFIGDWVSALFLVAALCFGWQDFNDHRKSGALKH